MSIFLAGKIFYEQTHLNIRHFFSTQVRHTAPAWPASIYIYFKTNIRTEKTKKQRVRALTSLSRSHSTALSLSRRRRVTAAPVLNRPDHRYPLSPSLHLAAAPLLSISLTLAADSIRGKQILKFYFMFLFLEFRIFV
jgi:hypothetical protein